ncbi:helix-turn-helix domain-containing protein [Vagococcus fluvialis]|uniref:helix-turn-helix domain-containing protein n=1 Tax=Vagococcus fluvialis TaxID=2738 RepID=UPI001D0A9495|nr:helix-turn-helix transcriptional regulator [Vagococcus fluvialis]UDM79583.1 helix-turn-helix domain-containing protein [Vagococcus fluvialis]
MRILDNIATKIADKVNAKNDEVMLLTQENDSLRQKLAASELTVSDYQKKIKKSDNELVRLNSKYTEVKKRLKDLSESGERQVDVIQEYSERIIELEEELKKNSTTSLVKELNKLNNINANQLKFIEILQVIASAKADKTQLKDVFSHNLCEYLVNNFDNVKQAADKLGINRTTLSELKSGKTALSYDNLDILDSKMCEYFKCSVYELVTVKLNKEASQ